jgi:hypothetical protein
MLRRPDEPRRWALLFDPFTGPWHRVGHGSRTSGNAGSRLTAPANSSKPTRACRSVISILAWPRELLV